MNPEHDYRSEFRAIAKKWHPDAHPNASLSEKRDLEKRFVEEMARLDASYRDREAHSSRSSQTDSPSPRKSTSSTPASSHGWRPEQGRSGHADIERDRAKREMFAELKAYWDWRNAQKRPVAEVMGVGLTLGVPVLVMAAAVAQGDASNGLAVAMMIFVVAIAIRSHRIMVGREAREMSYRKRYEEETGRVAP